MIFYFLYKVGYFIANTIPLRYSYGIGCAIADIYYYISKKDRRSVLKNLGVIYSKNLPDANELKRDAKEVFRNFAKYLVDFFRFSKINQEYIKKFVKIEGLENVDKALEKRKGVIILSAHIGNWELGAFVLSAIGYPISAVVLTHSNKRINDFFTRQRTISRMKPIEIGISLRECYTTLKNNRLLGLLGDRDFSRNGINADFFGKVTPIPKGPSIFSHRIGSAIVPSFMIREKDDTFKLVFEEPIFPNSFEDEAKAVQAMTMKYLPVVESYVKKYPTQWYVFKEVWNNHDKFLRSDTII